MWRRRTSSLRVRNNCAVLSASASLYAGICACAALCSAASDEQALRQALTIVQLLRAEYGRSFSSLTPGPTCAATTAPSSSGPIPSRRYRTIWYDVTSPRRRFDYDDGFGAHPSSIDTSTTLSLPSTTELSTILPQSDVSQDLTIPQSRASILPSSMSLHSAATVLTSTLSPTALSSTSISVHTSVLSHTDQTLEQTTSTLNLLTSTQSTSITELPPQSVPSKTSTKPVSVETLVSQNEIGIPITHTSSSIRQETVTLTPIKGEHWTKDDHLVDPPGQYLQNIVDFSAPELQQVAAELAGELEETGIDLPARLKLKSKRPIARVSWREYLGRSTRYAVPLPENHAFCYTDPHNALCRTFI